MTKNLLQFCLLLLTSLGLSAQASEEQLKEYLVKYNSSRGYNHLIQRSDQFALLDHHQKADLFKIGIPTSQRLNVLADLIQQPGIEYVVPNSKVRSFLKQEEVIAQLEGQVTLKDQWAITKVNARQAWERAGNKGKRNVVVAVIDTGVDYNHESLAPNSVPGFDFNENDADPMDATGSQNPGHGTHCAGIIGGTGLINGGILGLSPEVSIMPIRFLGADGSGDLNNAIKSIDFAIEKGAQIISASWGAQISEANAKPLIEALKRADDAGVIFVAAAANDGKDNDKVSMYPTNANFPNSISVAASNESDAKPSWSNFGSARVHIAAPGDKIMSTLPRNKYGNLSGTSMATPLVSGLVALLKAQDANLKGSQIRALIQTTGAPVNISTACNCRIDAFAAVDAVMNKKMFVAPAAATMKVGEKINLDVVYASGNLSYESSQPAVATVDAQGVVTAVAQGKTNITVRDSSGAVAKTLDFNVGSASSSNPPPKPGQPPGGGQPGQPAPGECPFEDPSMCQIICGIMPDAPFCSGK